MPAKITVRAELASLLAKSQETTDANRQAQLRREADLRADRQRLQAKEAKEAAASKKPLEDPVGRNIFTAAMGGTILSIGRVWVRQPQNTIGQNAFTVWSGDGLVSASVATPLVNPQQFVTWSIDPGPPENVNAEYGETGWYRFAPNTVYNVASSQPDVAWYSESGGDFRYRELPGETRPFDLITQRQPGSLIDGTTYNRSVNVLPIRGEACIVLVTWDVVTTGILVGANGLDVPRIISQGGDVVSGSAAFYVDRTTVRPISVPAGVAARPEPTVGTAVSPEINVPVSYDPWWTSSGPTEIGNAWAFTGNSDDDYGPYIQPFSFYTPVQYLWFRSGSNGWAGGAAQDLLDSSGYSTGSGDVPVSGVRALLPGNVANFRETLFRESISFGPSTTYALDRKALQRRDLADIVEDAVYDLDDPGWSPTTVKTAPDVSVSLPATSLRFWDWDRPSYCRQQLLALGFQSADLAPLPTP